MKAWSKCRGLICATFTPMHPDGSINTEMIKPYAEYLKKSGIEQVYVNGTAGEHASLTIDERKAVAEAWMRFGRAHMSRIIIHCGAGNLVDSRDLAAHAESLGADAVAAVAPTYFKPASLDCLIKYISEVAAACPNTPFMYYHIPMMTGLTDRTIDLFHALGQRIPNFIGVKHTSVDFFDAMQAAAFNNGAWDVVVGAETMLLGALSMNLDSSIGVTYTLLPKTCKRIYDAFHAGDLEEARRNQAYVQEFWEAAHKPGSVNRMIASFKTIVNVGPSGLQLGEPRLPIAASSAEETQRLQQMLQTLKVAEHEK